MRQYTVHLIFNELRFYEADGWNHDLMHSMLDQGDLQFTDGYFRLSHVTSPASFNLRRLTDLTSQLLDRRGQRVHPRERAIYLKYMSQHGIFTRGDGSHIKGGQ